MAHYIDISADVSVTLMDQSAIIHQGPEDLVTLSFTEAKALARALTRAETRGELT